MTLKAWFRKFHNRPLKIAAGFLLAIWFVFADRTYLSISEYQANAVKQTADLLGMATESKDRIMTESLIETLLSQGGATSAALCLGDQEIISANQDLLGCLNRGSFFEKIIESKIPGSAKLVLRAEFNMIASLSSLLSILGFGFFLVIAGFYFIQVAQNRIEKDILNPLFNKLLTDEALEINELRDLRLQVKQANDLEAQRAVTLAIQENNEQVAHDIRGPIQSITELLSRTDVRDAELNSALAVALHRANAVAESLLAGERKSDEATLAPAYDFARVVRDIVVEKRALFPTGEIDLIAPKHLHAKSPLLETSLARVLSNVVDNAIQASTDRKLIRISLARNDNMVLISIVDSGRGIPANILSKLGEKGVSFRDKSQPRGSGRGVYSAMKTLRDVGGSMTIESKEGLGTTVYLMVPTKAAENFSGADLVLVDNEEMVRLVWTVAAAREGKTCQVFSSIDELLASADSIPRSTPVYLDSDLGGGRKGQAYAPVLRELGFERIVLTTAHESLHGTTLPGVDAIIGKRFAADEASSKARVI